MDLMDLDDVKLMYSNKNLSCEIEAKLMVTCINKTEDEKVERVLSTNISINKACCRFSEATSDVTSTDLKYVSTIQTNATDTVTTTQPMNKCTCQAEKCITSIGLGVVVGLLVVLLAAVTTGWVWTCCAMKKRGRIAIKSNEIR